MRDNKSITISVLDRCFLTHTYTQIPASLANLLLMTSHGGSGECDMTLFPVVLIIIADALYKTGYDHTVPSSVHRATITALKVRVLTFILLCVNFVLSFTLLFRYIVKKLL